MIIVIRGFALSVIQSQQKLTFFFKYMEVQYKFALLFGLSVGVWVRPCPCHYLIPTLSKLEASGTADYLTSGWSLNILDR